MNDLFLRLVSCIVTSVLFFVGTQKCLGAMQQSGYHPRRFFSWMKRRDNLFFNRLSLLSLLLFLFSGVTSLCFSFVGARWSTLVSAVPFLVFLWLFCLADKKYALKVPVNRTARLKRLAIVYLTLVCVFDYLFITLLYFVARWIRSDFYTLFAYLPYAFIPMLLPFILILANGLTRGIESKRNKKFIRRAKEKIDTTPCVRVGIVGSYGKTSVKHIVKTLLKEEFSVCATPASYNTPIGIAKTAMEEDFAKSEIFLAEMGARKKGDIEELCEMVRPDYAVICGLCDQHVESFGSFENVVKTKAEVLAYARHPVLCSAQTRAFLEENGMDVSNTTTLDVRVENARFSFDETAFDVTVDGKTFHVKTPLLGKACVENISLAIAICLALGEREESIQKGLSKLLPIPHRLELTAQNGVYILDDSYNANTRSCKEALDALGRFTGRKFVVTPGIVETGVLEEKINGDLGKELCSADEVILVGETLVGAVKDGYLSAGGDKERLHIYPTLEEAKEYLKDTLREGDAVLFLNDLPDVY